MGSKDEDAATFAVIDETIKYVVQLLHMVDEGRGLAKSAPLPLLFPQEFRALVVALKQFPEMAVRVAALLLLREADLRSGVVPREMKK